MYVHVPTMCYSKKDPVEWQVISLNPPTCTTQSAPARARLVSVTMSRCWCRWAYRNWSVECLIDQTRQPLRWLSVRRPFSQSLSLWGPYLCCVFLLWLSVSLTKKELFLLKLTALNFRDNDVHVANSVFQSGMPSLRSVGFVNRKKNQNIIFFCLV